METQATIPRLRRKADAVYMQWVRSRVWRFARRSWVIQFGVQMVAFMLLHDLFYEFLRYKPEIFERPFLLGGIWQKTGPVLWIIAVCAFLMAVPRRTAWKNTGRPVRIAVAIVLVISVWGVGYTGFNYLTNQSYIFDRLLITLLLGLALWRPAFIAPLLAYLLLFMGQLRLSAGNMQTTETFPLFDVQIGLVGWLVLRTVLPMRVRSLVWFLVVLQAVNYFVPGVAKSMLQGHFDPLYWFNNEPIHHYILKSWLHGWYNSVDQQTIEWSIGAVAKVGPLLSGFTILFELGAAVLILWRRPAILMLVCGILLHLGIYSLAGVCFWKWIIVDAVLIYCMVRTRRVRSRKRDFLRVAAVAVLFACYPLYAAPKHLGWIDTRIVEAYVVDVIDEHGNVYHVDFEDLSPYDITFEQANFHYLNPLPTITTGRGSVRDMKVAEEVNALQTVEDARRYMEAHGERRYDEKEAADMDFFLRNYFTHVNEHAGSKTWANFVIPPRHIQTSRPEPHFDFKTPVKRVQVRYRSMFYDGERIHTLRDQVVREVVID